MFRMLDDTWGEDAKCFIEDSHKAMFRTLDDAWFWHLILKLNSDVWFWCLILMLDFDSWFWHFILMLDFLMLDFGAWFWCLILMLDFDAWLWPLILTLDFDSWIWHLITYSNLPLRMNGRKHNSNSRVTLRLKTTMKHPWTQDKWESYHMKIIIIVKGRTISQLNTLDVDLLHSFFILSLQPEHQVKV